MCAIVLMRILGSGWLSPGRGTCAARRWLTAVGQEYARMARSLRAIMGTAMLSSPVRLKSRCKDVDESLQNGIRKSIHAPSGSEEG